MYKTIGVIFCAILVLFCSPNCDFVGSFSDFNDGKAYFCTNSAIELPETTAIKNGKGYIILSDLKFARKVQNSISTEDLQGISVFFDRKIDCSAYLQKISAQKIFEETAGEFRFIYAYSPLFRRSVTYNGEKINIQIAKSGDKTTIGYPLILTGA